MQHQILINVIISVAYVLNLLLNTQRSLSRSQRAEKWSLILAHDRRPIYRAPTYIAVPLLGLPPTAIYQAYTVLCKVPWGRQWREWTDIFSVPPELAQGAIQTVIFTNIQGSTLIFPQLGSRATIKQYGLVRDLNLHGLNDNILFFVFVMKK